MPQRNKYENFPPNPHEVPRNFHNVVPSDLDELPFAPRAIYVGSGGDLAIEDYDGNQFIFRNLQSGTTKVIQPCKILDTGTTASNIIAEE